jgi:uncharacterized caspase-like protein
MTTDDAPARRRRALLIASATYVDPGLAALRAPTGDVGALADVLGDETIGGFEVDRLVDEPTDTIKRRIEDFFRDSRRQDLLLFYFSGHGVLAQDRRFYFATASTELQWVRTTAIDDRFVNEAMDQSRARSIVVLLDCCHSGAFGKGLVPKSTLSAGVEHRFDGHGRVTLTASDELEYAFEETDPASINELGAAEPGSLFTRCLVEGLRSGEADADRDGAISVDDLYDYVKQQVRERSAHQSPRMSGSVSGDIVIAFSARRAALPADLEAAVESSLAGVREGAVGELASLASTARPALAAVARETLERLVDDDSRRVSEAAQAALAGGAPAAAAPPSPAPVPPLPADAAPSAAAPPAAPPRSLSRRALATILIGVAALGAVVAAVLVLPGSGDDGGDAGAGASSSRPYVFGSDSRRQTIVLGAAGGSSAGGADGSGAVLLHAGTGEAATSSSITSTDAGVPAARARDRYGAALASGDFDDDGRADLAVGVPGRSLVAVLYASEGRFSPRGGPLAAADLEKPPGAGAFGASLAAADFDGNGVDDLLVGTPGTPQDFEANTGGAVYVFLGSGDGLSASNVQALAPPGESQLAFGEHLAVGDLNGDDNLDVVEGARDQPEFDFSGHLVMCLGQVRGPACEEVPGADGLGTSALAVADLNHDGFDEVLQADEAPWDGSEYLVGELRIWGGTAEKPVDEPLFISQRAPGVPGSASVGNGFGHALDAARLDSDPYADMVVGAPDDGAGSVTVIRGTRSVAPRADSYVLPAPDDYGGFGEAVAILDVDGDRRLDVVVAAGANRRLDDVLFVYEGTSTGIDPQASPTPLGGMGDLIDVEDSPLVLGR